MPRSAPFQRILVPMDFSASARAATVVAGNLARQLDAAIRFVTVLDVSDLRVALKARLDRFATTADLHREVEEWVEKQYASLTVPDGVTSTRTIRRGFADQEILAEIAKYRPQLVVMGSSGLARRLPIGSKTAEVLRRSSVPVVVCSKA
ncbi:MAG TPA: universal stress protein [Thermoanaerobaculia bacterium]|nr:universal stress protein [Thermoanaerobaculia bacterium]